MLRLHQTELEHVLKFVDFYTRWGSCAPVSKLWKSTIEALPVQDELILFWHFRDFELEKYRDQLQKVANTVRKFSTYNEREDSSLHWPTTKYSTYNEICDDRDFQRRLFSAFTGLRELDIAIHDGYADEEEPEVMTLDEIATAKLVQCNANSLQKIIVQFQLETEQQCMMQDYVKYTSFPKLKCLHIRVCCENSDRIEAVQKLIEEVLPYTPEMEEIIVKDYYAVPGDCSKHHALIHLFAQVVKVTLLEI